MFDGLSIDEATTSVLGAICLSYTQIDMFENCPRRWQFDYLEGLKEDSSTISLKYGTLIHSILEEALSTEMLLNIKADKETLNKKLLENQNIYEKFDVNKKTATEYNNKALRTIESCLTNTGNFEFLNGKEIIGVEQGFLLQFDTKPYKIKYKGKIIENDVFYIKGYIDLILRDEDGIYVIDHKTSKKKYAKSKLRQDLQMPIYALAIKKIFGEYPIKGIFNFVNIQEIQEVLFKELELNAEEIAIMNKRGAKTIWCCPLRYAKQRIFNVMNQISHKNFKACPSYLCYYCNHSLYQSNICPNSSDFKPKYK